MTDPYYDLSEDWELIAASFQSMYGLRLAVSLRDMKWREFRALLGGLDGNTPLGRIVAIRAETDPERLRSFTPEMRRVRAAWLTRRARQKPRREVDAFLAEMKRAFLSLTDKEG